LLSCRPSSGSGRKRHARLRNAAWRSASSSTACSRAQTGRSSRWSVDPASGLMVPFRQPSKFEIRTTIGALIPFPSIDALQLGRCRQIRTGPESSKNSRVSSDHGGERGEPI
jgi:hypothetical protein